MAPEEKINCKGGLKRKQTAVLRQGSSYHLLVIINVMGFFYLINTGNKFSFFWMVKNKFIIILCMVSMDQYQGWKVVISAGDVNNFFLKESQQGML